MQKDVRWTCPECGRIQQEPMHSDPDTHFVSTKCDQCGHETDMCPCGFGEIIDTSSVEPQDLPSSPLWSINRLADYLSVDRQTVYRWIKTGKIKSVKIGHSVRVEEKEIEKLLRP